MSNLATEATRNLKTPANDGFSRVTCDFVTQRKGNKLVTIVAIRKAAICGFFGENMTSKQGLTSLANHMVVA